jgi:hypothetical protein
MEAQMLARVQNVAWWTGFILFFAAVGHFAPYLDAEYGNWWLITFLAIVIPAGWWLEARDAMARRASRSL